MVTYLIKRIFAMIPTLIGITLLTFFIVKLAPGDPVAAKMGGGAVRGTDDSGGADSAERQADAIKAKKKLLGMMEEQHAVLAWDAAEAARARDWQSDDKYKQVADMTARETFPDEVDWPRALALSPDGERLYAGFKGGAVRALDPATGDELTDFSPHGENVRALAVSPDGSLLVSADSAGAVRVHAAATGELRAEPDPLGKAVRCVTFLPDGTHFLTGCDDGIIRKHAAADGRTRDEYRGHIAYIAEIAAAPDGSRFWSVGYDRVLREWNTATGKVQREIGEHGQAVTGMALAADATFLATSCEDKIVRVWSLDAPDGAEPLEFEGHFNSVTAVAIHPDGRTLFSGSRDETLRTWDIEQQRQTAQVPINIGRVDALLLSKDGDTLYSAGESWRETPITKQYLRWAGNVARLEFGRSFKDNVKVIDKIKERLPVTLGLNLLAVAIIYLISIPQGVYAAVKRGGLYDHVSTVVLFMLWSLPSFWVATLLIMNFSSERTWNALPSNGLHARNQIDLSYVEWLQDWGAHLVLPMTCLVYAGFTALSRYARTSVLDVISQDFIRTARAKGLSERVVIFKHALRNALIPIVTLLGTLLPGMIGGSVIVEYIFNIRGMGLLAFEAILARDYPVIMAVTTFGGFLTLLGILLSDILYSVVDPRITHR